MRGLARLKNDSEFILGEQDTSGDTVEDLRPCSARRE